MKPNSKFLNLDKSFWACVRSLSQQIGYTVKGKNTFKVPTPKQMAIAFDKLGLDSATVLSAGRPTELAKVLNEYFEYRANALISIAEPNLMDVDQARAVYEDLRSRLEPKCPMPMNKQKGEKKASAYLTCIVNMLVDKYSKGACCDYDPKKLTTVTSDGQPLRTLSRRVDGAFPSSVNPTAIWEIKEYYYTTTFGSRVADGVYETLLDGMELEELREYSDIDVKHYLVVDAYRTWWKDGKSYLCRIIDMLHMGYVDEVLFGREVLTEMPRIVSEWIDILDEQGLKKTSARQRQPALL